MAQTVRNAVREIAREPRGPLGVGRKLELIRLAGRTLLEQLERLRQGAECG